MKDSDPPVIYWDSSGILSVLFRDSNSAEASRWAGKAGVHLVSSLGFSEVHAVARRIQREGHLPNKKIETAVEFIDAGPWRRLNIQPGWDAIKSLAQKWPLRGADLWHLAAAKALQESIPELRLLTFDNRLNIAAEGEDLGI